VRRPLFAGLTGATLLALAGPGCDVRLRPIWYPPEDASAPPDATISYCPDGPSAKVGFAFAGGPTGTTTGGGTAPPVTVSAADADALTQFKSYADRKSGPAVIQVLGLIDFAGFGDSQVRVASDTTIVGLDASSGFTGGGLDLNGNSNIIIKNLVIARAAGTDAVTVQGPGSTNIWIDHCDLSSELHPDGASYDGLVDITHAADFVTVSWTVFHDHRDTGIIGHSDSNASEDTGHLHVTYAHDLFRRVDAGPRVRFGTVHVFNVFFDQVTLYGVASTMSADVRVERSSFRNVTAAGQNADYGPITTLLPDASMPGFVDLPPAPDNNAFDASDAAQVILGHTDEWTPPYAYSADSAASVPTVVVSCAGPRPVPGAL
jgi:pectate lyase